MQILMQFLGKKLRIPEASTHIVSIIINFQIVQGFFFMKISAGNSPPSNRCENKIHSRLSRFLEENIVPF